jgi:hypothetical protein
MPSSFFKCASLGGVLGSAGLATIGDEVATATELLGRSRGCGKRHRAVRHPPKALAESIHRSKQVFGDDMWAPQLSTIRV